MDVRRLVFKNQKAQFSCNGKASQRYTYRWQVLEASLYGSVLRTVNRMYNLKGI